ncbi:hypothetical protein FHW71_000407 [Enterobacter sp. Sphag1F]|jgi:hypothetical protein|nr:hypothetical protein [Enterobacter sp. Sphag1F]NYI12991.1 hypothetical protein [Enterobacter sp. Sphag71]
MSHIMKLIVDLTNNTLSCQFTAHRLLSEYSIDEQCALITAILIGRDHIKHNKFIEYDKETIGYFGPSRPFSRYLFTGHAPNWRIRPEEFASILSSKSDNINIYCEAFIRCAHNSGYDLYCF